MLRAVIVALFCLLAAGTAAAQQSAKKDSRQARPGESCLKFHTDCGLWCDANQSGASNQAACKKQCSDDQSTCLQTGIWSTPLARADIRGLPPK